MIIPWSAKVEIETEKGGFKMIYPEPVWYRLSCDFCMDTKSRFLERSIEKAEALAIRLGWDKPGHPDDNIHRCKTCKARMEAATA